VTGSSATGSALLAGLTIAAAVGGPLFGVLLDRSSRPDRVLALSLAAYAAGTSAVAAALGRLPMPLVVLITLAAGLFNPAVASGWTSQLPRIVAGPGLSRGFALDAMTYSAASLAGPALADAGRAEPLPGRQRGDHVSGLMPGRPHCRRPGGREARRAAEVVTLPDPYLVHDRLVVVAGESAQFGPDPGQAPRLARRHLGDGAGYDGGFRLSHCQNVRCGGRTVKCPLPTLPLTSIRSTSGTA